MVQGNVKIRGRKYSFPLLITIIILGLILYLLFQPPNSMDKIFSQKKSKVIKLPKPSYSSKTSIEKALLLRRSIRDYKDEPLRLSEVSQLLWSAQGITDKRGLRTAPSAGATYPLGIYIVVGNVLNLKDGIYYYNPNKHELRLTIAGDMRDRLSKAALGQDCIKRGAVNIVISAVNERTTAKYRMRGTRYIYIEVGHVAQNIYLQSVSLNLGTVIIGAFDDNEVKKVLSMGRNENPMCIMPIGRP
ncbi:MAG: SagB/ThcOx family dehydrogenase [Spirochaetota bacterium]|nr:SagB/ThcOx family dehydrogenase [Spirochaetota bacterium]